MTLISILKIDTPNQLKKKTPLLYDKISSKITAIKNKKLFHHQKIHQQKELRDEIVLS